MENYKKWLGREVEVIIDRPIGSVHPKFNNLKYKLNYGYIAGEISEFDNEEVDAYVLGVSQPIDKYKGKVIAIIKRSTGDEEYKLVVANKQYDEKEISKMVYFQEKFFESKIIL
ncbi:MAG: inorganic pyrophosphatase [bacterium]|nr:inorganic pyrophosphatase [bacterium]